ncbi:hypothetical protein L198_03254 [Cryptococcus wingfieldii CBS 7118]|uniref:Uncharacterized protein n=1 Tax=Cryptococcus wingfieldii CBS 7118 TaxID=1295528 RepID=A0A1E3JF05_9TREE|nr:hypothetical protein L198_03254 [Cryptococcus wingfieldii CBS 7118]ODN99412.1 hypothetical protein L198_03254 [Cryptococcus wingfieldii CBS 7118]
MTAQEDQSQQSVSTTDLSVTSLDGGVAEEGALEQDTYLDENNQLRYMVYYEEPDSITVDD